MQFEINRQFLLPNYAVRTAQFSNNRPILQLTGAPPAAASLPETGSPPGEEGGGTAQPQTQADQPTQQGQTVSIIEYDPPFNPLEEDEGE